VSLPPAPPLVELDALPLAPEGLVSVLSFEAGSPSLAEQLARSVASAVRARRFVVVSGMSKLLSSEAQSGATK
jgi:hypothetical protein